MYRVACFATFQFTKFIPIVEIGKIYNAFDCTVRILLKYGREKKKWKNKITLSSDVCSWLNLQQMTK